MGACCEGGVPPCGDASKDQMPRGELITLGGDLPCYEVGQGEKAIIVVYDIFGFKNNRTKKVCDMISDHGYRVILPDFFRGTDVLEEFGGVFPPPGGMDDVIAWCVNRFSPPLITQSRSLVAH